MGLGSAYGGFPSFILIFQYAICTSWLEIKRLRDSTVSTLFSSFPVWTLSQMLSELCQCRRRHVNRVQLISCRSQGNIQSQLWASNQPLQDLQGDPDTEVLSGRDITLGCDGVDTALDVVFQFILVHQPGSRESTELSLLIAVKHTIKHDRQSCMQVNMGTDTPIEIRARTNTNFEIQAGCFSNLL